MAIARQRARHRFWEIVKMPRRQRKLPGAGKGSLRNPKFWPEYRLKRSIYVAWIRIRPFSLHLVLSLSLWYFLPLRGRYHSRSVWIAPAVLLYNSRWILIQTRAPTPKTRKIEQHCSSCVNELIAFVIAFIISCIIVFFSLSENTYPKNLILFFRSLIFFNKPRSINHYALWKLITQTGGRGANVCNKKEIFSYFVFNEEAVYFVYYNIMCFNV